MAWKAAVRGFVVMGLLAASSLGQADDVVPGPENGGLRLRLVVTKGNRPRLGELAVRLDLVNTTADKITLRSGWEGPEEGDVKEYLTHFASVQTYPPLEPARGGKAAFLSRTTPQKELTLAGHETLSLQWQTDGRRLKNESDLFAENPDFVEPGLYAVHVTLNVITATGTHRLRSNEQFVQIGGSSKQPRHTFGRLTSVRSDKTGEFSLGSLDQVRAGDRFSITSKSGAWRLTVSEARERYSDVRLERVGDEGPELPEAGAGATLERVLTK